MHEIPPTTPPAVFAGNFVYAVNLTTPYYAFPQTGPTDPGYDMTAAQAIQMAETQKRKRETTTQAQQKAYHDLRLKAQANQPVTTNQGNNEWSRCEPPQTKHESQKRKMTESQEEKEKNRILKKRQKKDPKAPKRNMSAFLFFSNVRRAEVKKQHPDLSFSEIAKELSQMWRTVSIEEKRDYTERARKDKVRYFQEKKVYDDQCKAMGISVPDEAFSEEEDDEIMDDEVFEAKLEQLDGMDYSQGQRQANSYVIGLGGGPVSLSSRL